MAECQLEAVSFHGWEGIQLMNGLISAVAVPELGGRILSFALGPYQYLFLNRELAGKRFTPEEHTGDGSLLAWKNYGGDKTWPAPQGWERDDQWPGPPDAILDSGRYEAFQDAATCSLTMSSPPDPRTGLRIYRRATLLPQQAKLRLDLTFENIVDRPIRWSIWDVMQLDCSRLSPQNQISPDTNCWLYIPVEADSTPSYWVMFGDNNPQWQAEVVPGVMAVQYLGHVGKIGVASRAGWIAFANQSAGFVLCLRFPYEPNAEYPDGGASIECWTESPEAIPPIPLKSAGHVLEAEVLSPLRTLQPGQKTSLWVEWAAAYCPGPITQVNEVSCTHQPLNVIAGGGWAQMQGSFGCFVPGQAQLSWLDKSGRTLQQIALQQVSPLSTLKIHQVVPLPDEAARCRLDLIRSDGVAAGQIDEAELQPASLNTWRR